MIISLFGITQDEIVSQVVMYKKARLNFGIVRFDIHVYILYDLVVNLIITEITLYYKHLTASFYRFANIIRVHRANERQTFRDERQTLLGA